MKYLKYILCMLILSVNTAIADDVGTAVVREGISAAFEEFERQMIYKYFDANPYHGYHDYDDHKSRKSKKNKGNGKGLPPGIEMKLERGGTMPPGIAKRYLPADLERDLPPVPHGYERSIVGNDVVLVEVDTGKIADIIAGVIVGD